jgi:hypothetical protein
VWDFRFSRWWVRRWLSSGMLRYIVWWKFTDVSEVLAASIIRAMNTPCMRNWFEKWEPVGQGRTLAGPVGKRVRIMWEQGGQWEKGKPQSGQTNVPLGPQGYMQHLLAKVADTTKE